jgi:hypothetical protein
MGIFETLQNVWTHIENMYLTLWNRSKNFVIFFNILIIRNLAISILGWILFLVITYMYEAAQYYVKIHTK